MKLPTTVSMQLPPTIKTSIAQPLITATHVREYQAVIYSTASARAALSWKGYLTLLDVFLEAQLPGSEAA